MVTQEFETTELAAEIRPNGHIFGVVTRCQTDIFLSTFCFKALIPKQATAAGRISLQQEETEPGSSWETLLLMASRREDGGLSNLYSHQQVLPAAEPQPIQAYKHGSVPHPPLFTWRLAAAERTTITGQQMCHPLYHPSHRSKGHGGSFKGVRADPDTAFR